MCEIADFSGPQDARVEQRQEEKLDKYPDLAREVGHFAASDHVL